MAAALSAVCACACLAHQAKVAIKKVSKAFDDVIDAKRTLREIKLLRHLNHPNVRAAPPCPVLPLLSLCPTRQRTLARTSFPAPPCPSSGASLIFPCHGRWCPW